MSQLAIRQSGGASIISLPKAILSMLGLKTGSVLDLSIKNNAIVLKPVNKKMTLEDLLAGSPQDKLRLTEEDFEWMQDSAMGKELL